jgi:WhiB family redox-sensing transcriptional regulator
VTASASPRLDLDTAWMDHALCTGVDPELFFPERGESTEPAKAVCRQCTACAACLEYAIVQHELFGVWGGTSERERRKLRRERLLKQYGHVPRGRRARETA